MDEEYRVNQIMLEEGCTERVARKFVGYQNALTAKDNALTAKDNALTAKDGVISATIKVAEQAVFAAINLLIAKGLWCGQEKDVLLYHVHALRKQKEMCAQAAEQHISEQGPRSGRAGKASFLFFQKKKKKLVHACGREEGAPGVRHTESNGDWDADRLGRDAWRAVTSELLRSRALELYMMLGCIEGQSV
jgi:hypothetical protein